ncbi:GGDEF domain-containing protein [Candidatus Magnetaquicoccus inordinatus]|uniref:GGDEF domain-containing protein n=1 Tax=Candidatus Magnetaquicoccus inordinatus TaxID=2496818 RepID=UPI00102BA772|nr:GGDEF domain-containing protein [Candidatus Magnetaquicoccus inordinatus]
MNMRDILFSRLANIYFGSLRYLMLELRDVVLPEIPAIVLSFFKEIHEVDELATLIDNSVVTRNLLEAMDHWWSALFRPTNALEVEQFILRQLEIGSKHADLNINLHYIHHAIRIFKREIHSRLEFQVESTEKQVAMAQLLDELLDIVSSLMSDSYFKNLVKYETDTLSLRMNALSQNVAIECERVRSQLLDWSKNILFNLFQNRRIDPDTMVYAEYSVVGMWVFHKAELLLPEPAMVDKLKHYLRQIDMELSQAATLRSGGLKTKFINKVRAFDSHVNQTAWYLSSLVEQIVKLDAGRDTLTSLYNRRYLDTVLRRETEISMKQGYSYSLLLLDIDFFKKINDTYGHDAGDAVLRQFSELLVGTLRISDFLFRLGGEEFLAVLGNTSSKHAIVIAEKIRRECEQRPFVVHHDQVISVTCSIGVAVYKGHPDYNLLLKQADQALYAAKQSGRNRHCLAGEEQR